MTDWLACLYCVIVLPFRFLLWPFAFMWDVFGESCEMTGKVKLKWRIK